MNEITANDIEKIAEMSKTNVASVEVYLKSRGYKRTDKRWIATKKTHIIAWGPIPTWWPSYGSVSGISSDFGSLAGMGIAQ
ncbi:MAG: hypothetical protein KDE20_25315 [Caldilineaceae bacterium]|nr:hypothetical protein [Caldilineaceae bacterium]